MGDETLTEANQIMFFGLYIFCIVLGVVGNYLSLRTFWRETATFSYHLQLTIANICGLITIVLSAPAVLQGKWLFGTELCTWFGFQAFLSGYASMFFTCIICMHTGMVVYYTDKGHKTILTYMPVIAATWCGSFVLGLAPVLGWNTYVKERHSTSCALDLNQKGWAYQSKLVVAMVVFILMTIGAVVGLIIAAAKSKEGRMISESTITERKYLTISAALLCIALVSALPYTIRVLQYVGNVPPVFRHFISVEFSHLALKFGYCLQPAAFLMLDGAANTVVKSANSNDTDKKKQ